MSSLRNTPSNKPPRALNWFLSAIVIAIAARTRASSTPPLVPGSGVFTGEDFYPLVPDLGPPTVHSGRYVVRDFTRGMQEMLVETGLRFDVGRYNERRRAMYTTDLFGTGSDASFLCTDAERREIHVGVDIGGPAGTAVHAVAAGSIHSAGYNPAAGDYGHVIVTEHSLGGRKWWALHGHLSAASIEGKRVGDTILRGELLGWLGEEHENGGWPPHVHFQLSWEEPETHDMPGVVSDSQHARALRTYPDPRMVLGAELYKGGGLFE